MTPESLDEAVAEAKRAEASYVLRIAGPVLCGYYAFLVMGHAAVLTGSERSIMMTSAATTAVLLGTIATAVHGQSERVKTLIVPLLNLCGLATAFNAVLHLVIIPEPFQTTNIMLVVVATSLFLGSRAGLAAVYAVCGLVFLGVATTVPSPDWVHFGFALASTAALGLTLFYVRERKLRFLTKTSLDEQTARASLESAITQTKLSELRFRTVVDRCPDAIFIIRDGVIRYANPAAEILLDVREGSVVGTGVEALRPAGSRLLLGDNGDRVELLDSSGQTICVATSTTQVQFEGKSVQVVFARDMSERLASEKLQSDFLAAVSHELRTPLTSVVGALGLLTRTGRDSRERTLLDVASRNARRLGELIEDLLDLRTLETLDDDDLEDVALATVVQTAISSFADPGNRIKIHTNEAVWVHADPRALARVVHHLVDNAVKFGGADKDIDICIGTVADDACIHVSDRGPGVPRRYRETVFNTFAQGKAGLARPHGGFGVGLTLSRGIVEQHKGRMTLHDRDGGGATVTICLPRIQAPAG